MQLNVHSVARIEVGPSTYLDGTEVHVRAIIVHGSEETLRLVLFAAKAESLNLVEVTEE